jgi:hypothetical protein
MAMSKRAFFSDRGRDASGTASTVTRRGHRGKVIAQNLQALLRRIGSDPKTFGQAAMEYSRRKPHRVGRLA